MFKLLPAILFCGVASLHAVVVSGPDGTINTTGTNAGAGWDYVGAVNGASGVYIGEYAGGYWVLGASHVGPGNLVLSGTNYNYVSGSTINILNPDLTPADLIAFRIDTPPPSLTSNLALATTAPVGGNVKMVGYGRNRDAPLTTWFVDTGTSPNVWTGTSTPESDITRQGYLWAAGNTKRWGNNVVSGTTTVSYSVSGTTQNVRAITTSFDNINGEGQAAEGDSGGGIFHLNDNGTGSPLDDFWELSGLMVVISEFSGQPGETAVYGTSTYSVDIAYYRNAILSAVPEPASALLVLTGIGAITLAARRGRRGGRSRPSSTG